MGTLLRAVIHGVAIGICVGFLVALGASALAGETALRPTSAEAMSRFPSPLAATAYSALIWAALGLMFALAGHFILRGQPRPAWRRRLLHAGVTAVLFTGLAVLAGWAPLTPVRVLRFFVSYLVLYAAFEGVRMGVRRLLRPRAAGRIEGTARG
ncbi:MAG: DUF3021 domain-containing protein [Pseudoclavibacter sp.]